MTDEANSYETATSEQLDADYAELIELEALLYQLPDALVLPRSGKTSAAEYRTRMSAALRAMSELVYEVRVHPVGVTRARLIAVLSRWRQARARCQEILRHRRRSVTR